MGRALGAEAAGHWTLDPAVTFLNHGSFGACPREVLEVQAGFRAQLEREPVHFFNRLLEPLLDAAREALASFVGARPEDLAFVSNASSGVSTVLRSLRLAPGDELVCTNHGYNACRNALEQVAEAAGARVVEARVPFPLRTPEEVLEPLLAAVSPRTRLVLVDHVTSPTGVVFPIEALVERLAARGVDTLVDGAHGPGMLPLALEALGAAYYTGNCHKWMSTPKGAAFLHVRRDRQAQIHPLSATHGRNSVRTDRSRFRLEFDQLGTQDPSPFLCVPAALKFFEGFEGGWKGVMAHNAGLARSACALLCERLGTPPPCPEEMLGSLAAVSLPPLELPRGEAGSADPVHRALFERFGIEVPVNPFAGARWLRVSAQVYNHPSQYQRLADALDVLYAQAP